MAATPWFAPSDAGEPTRPTRMNTSVLEDDIARIAVQERRLLMSRLDATSAWVLGSALKSMAEERGVSVTIEIRIARETVFLFAMAGCAPANADWARRKRNTVELLHRSSYAVGCELRRDGGSLDQTMGLAARDHASHGGSFPLLLVGTGCIGAVTVSGLPQRDDHELVVAALAAHCGVPYDEIALT
jgi:uncharacterized protein (UPF0303 family)